MVHQGQPENKISKFIQIKAHFGNKEGYSNSSKQCTLTKHILYLAVPLACADRIQTGIQFVIYAARFFDDVASDSVIVDQISNLIITFLHPNHAKFIHPRLINLFFRSKRPCVLEGTIFNHLTCHLSSDVTPGFRRCAIGVITFTTSVREINRIKWYFKLTSSFLCVSKVIISSVAGNTSDKQNGCPHC